MKSNFDRNLKGGYRFGYMFKHKTYRLIYRVNHPVNRSYAVVRYFVKYRWGTCSRQPKNTLFGLVLKIGYVGGESWVFLFVSPNPIWVSSHWQTKS